MGEKLMVQTSAPWWIQVFDYLAPHWWGIAAVLVAPLVGYAATQRFRTHARYRPSGFQLATVSGMVTFTLSFLMWWKGYRDPEGALLVAIIMGLGYPIVFTGIMGAMKRWWPWGYERLRARPPADAKTNGNDNGGPDKPFFPRW